MKVRIIVDSTADLTPEVKERVHIVPLTVNFGEEKYIDGVTIDSKMFYEKLVKCEELPTTSLANPAAFMKEFEEVKKAEESAVVITISPNLSGTHQSAVIASEEYENIYVIDSGSVAAGSGILIERALSLADEGKSAKEIKDILEEEKKKIVIIALLDTLTYLKKGGRISKTVAFAGSILNIKPILSVVDGEIKMADKARGTKKGNSMVCEQIEKAGGADFSKPVLIGYNGFTNELLDNYIKESGNFWGENITKIRYVNVGSVVGTHSGPNAIIIAFFKKN